MSPLPSGYVSGYEWDIFISYARQDNEARFGSHWVSDFALELQTAIRARLGHSEIRVFRDQEVLKGNATLDELLPAARSSAIFLAICSPTYVLRDWTRDEVKAFAAANRESSRLFGIDILFVEPDRYPPELSNKIRLKFWDKQGDKAIPTTISLQWAATMYREQIETLASEIAEQLEHLQHAATAKHLDLSPGITTSRSAPTALKTVLLAATFEERKRLSKLKNGLQQYPKDIQVVYAGDFPMGGTDFTVQFTQAIKNADLMVQILGETPGAKPPDLPEGYTSLQMRLASEFKVPLWQWRSRDLDLSELEDEDYLRMLQAESVEVTSLDELREKILAFGRKPPARGVAPSPETVLFINAHGADRSLAESVKLAFADKLEIRFSPTMFGSGQGKSERVREMLALNFCESDVLVFLYRKSDPDWLQSQYDFLKNLLGYQLNPAINTKSLEIKAKKLGVVYIGPPEDLPVFNSLPYIREVFSPPDGDIEPLLNLIRESLA